MRKLLVVVFGCLIVLLVVAAGVLVVLLHELADPASGTSASFTTNFVEKCVAAAGANAQAAQAGTSEDNITAICQCGADDIREDLSDAGIGGVAHMVLIEGMDAKMQRVMDACQSTPSAP